MADGLIERLFGMPLARFRAEHWPARPAVAAGGRDALAELAAVPALRGVAELLEARLGAVWLHRRTAAGSYDHETSVDPGAAAGLFAAGTMLDIRDLQRSIPVVQAWLARLHAELAVELAAGTGYCHAFVSPAGTGVPKHFDNREVIVVQLVGRKRWRVAPEPALAMPLRPHVAGMPAHAFNRAAGAVLDDPGMPASAASHELGPGAALFVPRGHWHATEALDDSLSLSFGLRAPSWAEVLVNTALSELAREPAWRAAARDLTGRDSPQIAAFRRGVARILDELRGVAPPAGRDEDPA